MIKNLSKNSLLFITELLSLIRDLGLWGALVFLNNSLWYQIKGRKIRPALGTQIIERGKIIINGSLTIGKARMGFMLRNEPTLLDIEGTLIINGSVYIGKGCRIHVAKGGICTFENCYLTGMTTVIASKEILIGAGSLIAWGCELNDRDWHQIDYPGRRNKPMSIKIGKGVWVGSHAMILKGVEIEDGVVIGAKSLVVNSCRAKTLVAGNPAKLVRENVTWTADQTV